MLSATRLPVILLLFLPLFVFAQQKECVFIDWSKHYGGSKSDGANDMQRTADGGFILAGYARSQDQDLTQNFGEADYWVVKLDSLGELEWQRNYGGSDNDIASAVLQTPDGGYIVAGGSVSFDGQVTGNHGVEDVWMLRIDPVGNIVWKKTYGGSQNDRAESIQPTADGGYIVAGYSQSDDGDLTENEGDFDYWVFKINATGALQWQRNLGGSLADYAFDAVQTSDGGFLVAGSSFSNDGDVGGNAGFYDYWIVKLDVAGNFVWEKNFGGVGEERAYGIALTPTGAVIAGTSNSASGNLPANNGSYDYWAMKISPTGGLVWSRNLGGSTEDRAFAITPTSTGGVLVGGLSASSNFDVGGNHGSRDAWLVNLDENGQTIWEKNFGGSLDDRFFALLELAGGGYACAGYSTSNDIDLDGNNGEQDLWVVRLSPDSIEIDLGNDTILCAGQGLILDVEQANVNYLWPDGSTLPVFLVSSPGEYWVEIDKQGCKSRDSVLVDYVSETPVSLGNDTTLCAGETLVLDPGIPGADVFWENGSTAATLPVQQPGSFWVEVSRDGCEYRDTIEVDFTTVPFDLGDDRFLCAGQTVLLDVTLPGATYLWQDGSTEARFTVASPGTVWAEVTQGGCNRTDTLIAIYQPGPENVLPDYSFICEGEGIWLNASFERAEYLWQDGSTEPNFKAVMPGGYSVQVTVNGCVFEDEVSLRPCEACLYVPNVFSPNGDGFNDEFRGFPGCDISNFEMRVFDRWGNIVFENGNPEAGWDGEYLDKKATVGVYAYRIDFDYLNNGQTEHQTRLGTVSLLR
ncbi:MAG: gliding motility-associated C-terminal domain-containing protein [Bacteroidetes bacterium]|nr:gliding motility-associated C-terminal domain-containing protein [Bacteroidota bacterium]